MEGDNAPAPHSGFTHEESERFTQRLVMWGFAGFATLAVIGTLAGVPPRVSLLPPLLVVILVLVVSLGALSTLRLRAWAAALAGLFLFAATLVPLPSLGRFEMRWRSNMLAWLGPRRPG